MSPSEFTSLLDGAEAPSLTAAPGSHGVGGGNPAAFGAALAAQLQGLAVSSSGWDGRGGGGSPEMQQVVVVLQVRGRRRMGYARCQSGWVVEADE